MKKVKLNEIKNMKGSTNWSHLKKLDGEPHYTIDTPEIKSHQLNEMKRVNSTKFGK